MQDTLMHGMKIEMKAWSATKRRLGGRSLALTPLKVKAPKLRCYILTRYGALISSQLSYFCLDQRFLASVLARAQLWVVHFLVKSDVSVANLWTLHERVLPSSLSSRLMCAIRICFIQSVSHLSYMHTLLSWDLHLPYVEWFLYRYLVKIDAFSR